jgi:biotin operon repressor
MPTDLQDKILGMLLRGMTQQTIAAKLHKSTGTISWHIRRLRDSGRWVVEAKEYLEPAPLRSGKRKCAACGKYKTPGAFPSENNAKCTMCFRNRSGSQ